MKKNLIITLFLLLFFPNRTFAVTQPKTFPSTANFVPGEIIVKFKEDESPQVLEQKVAASEARAASVFGRILNRIDEFRTHLAGQKTAAEKLAQITSVGKDFNVYESRPLRLADFILIKASLDQPITRLLTAYQALPQVEFAEANRIFHVTRDVNDPYYEDQWALTKIEVASAWDKATGDSNIKIAVVDTGVDYNHPDLSSNIIKGYDFSTCNYSDPDTGKCLVPKSRDSDPADEHGHGTHLAGVISALTNNGQGIAGINWTTKILAVRVLGADGSGSLADILDGISYAIDNGAKVINLSLGGRGSCPSSYVNLFTQAKREGITVVVAAGNENRNASGFTPANCPNVITVAATGPDDEKAAYSNYGSTIEISAPGGNVTEDRNDDGWLNSKDCIIEECILSTVPNNQYTAWEGTSMAAPHVSGVVGLILSADSTLSVDQVTNILTSTADDLGSPGKDSYFGAGRVNAKGAVEAVSPFPTPTSTPTFTPTPTPLPTATSTPSPTPLLTITPAATSTPTPTNKPTPTPTEGVSPPPTKAPTPTPTVAPSGCPSQCPKEALSRSKGNADCNQVIDDRDYNIWKTQFEIYAQGEKLAKEQRTADFNCNLNDPKTQVVDLADFEFWRRNANFSLIPTPTPSPTPKQPTPTSSSFINISGNWQFKVYITAPVEDEGEFLATFTQENGDVTGTIKYEDQEIPITGKVEDNTFLMDEVELTLPPSEEIPYEVVVKMAAKGTISEAGDRIDGRVFGQVVSPIESPLEGTFEAQKISSSMFYFKTLSPIPFW